MSTTDHWDDVYRSRPEEDLGWYEPVPSTLPDVLEFAHDRSARIVDVGAGASRLADELIDRGYEAVTLVDVSDAAFDRVRQRLAARGLPEPTIVVADATGLDLGGEIDLWHDRAVFHFLTDADARVAYVDAADRSVGPGGAVVVAAFAPDGPESCAGLPVERYDADRLTAEFSRRFASAGCRHHRGTDTDGDVRPYTICRFRKRGDRDVRSAP